MSAVSFGITCSCVEEYGRGNVVPNETAGIVKCKSFYTCRLHWQGQIGYFEWLVLLLAKIWFDWLGRSASYNPTLKKKTKNELSL